MAYDEALARRVREALKRKTSIAEQKMFGGIAFMLNGNMCCGVMEAKLMVRLGNDGADAALKGPHTKRMDFTGKPSKSMIYVHPRGYASDQALKQWVKRAVTFVSSLPSK